MGPVRCPPQRWGATWPATCEGAPGICSSSTFHRRFPCVYGGIFERVEYLSGQQGWLSIMVSIASRHHRRARWRFEEASVLKDAKNRYKRAKALGGTSLPQLRTLTGWRCCQCRVRAPPHKAHLQWVSLLELMAFPWNTDLRGWRCGASCLEGMCSLRQSTSNTSKRNALLGSFSHGRESCQFLWTASRTSLRTPMKGKVHWWSKTSRRSKARLRRSAKLMKMSREQQTPHPAPREWKPHPVPGRFLSQKFHRHPRARQDHFWIPSQHHRQRHPAQVALKLRDHGATTGITTVLVVNGAGGKERGTTGMRPAVDGSCGVARCRWCSCFSRCGMVCCLPLHCSVGFQAWAFKGLVYMANK